ncbi:hypothetical protein [Magnetovibrio blakemorei]|nr:hypothetical protein [Magnetovibrio blakemorei]
MSIRTFSALRTSSFRGSLAKSVVFSGVVFSIALGPVSAQAEACMDAAARTALEMRVLQSELMVAALTCGQRPSYNAFVTTFKPYLMRQGGQLKSFFVKSFGPKQGAEMLNKTVTRLANSASQNSLAVSTQMYCDSAAARFAVALKSTPQDLVLLARTNPDAASHGYKSCVEVADSSVANDKGISPEGMN